MDQTILKKLLPHLLSILVLLVFAVGYFAPSAFEGKVLQQGDVMQAEGMSAEIIKYQNEKNRDILWTNSAFSGMPTYQIWMGNPKELNFAGQFVYKASLLFGNITAAHSLLFAGFLGFYILLITLGLNWKYSLAGALLYGLNTSHMLWLEAGHVNKVLALTYLAPILAGVWLIFKRKYLAGTALTALFVSVEIYSNHLQITYYFYLLLGLLLLFYAVISIREKQIKHLLISVACIGLATLIGVATNLTVLWTTYEYSQETIRGKSELTTKAAMDKGTGLTKEYAYNWSMSKMETFSLLAPDYLGGSSSESFVQDQNSNTLKTLRSMQGVDPNQLVRYTTKYWGEQPFVGGSWYYGAALIFLFILGMFIVQNKLKYWVITSLGIILAIGWGKNFAAFNYFLFDHLPLFNKFRDPKMIYSIGHIFLVLMAILGLCSFLDENTSADRKKKSLYYALGTSLGICLLAWALAGTTGYQGPHDDDIAKYPALLDAIREDRAAYLKSDMLRSIFYIILTGALLFVGLRSKKSANWLLPVIVLVALFDVVQVDKRYLSNDLFKTKSNRKQDIQPSEADKQILQDKDPNYRVLDLSRGNPFQSAYASNFHKSIGGYHAASLLRYRELTDKYELTKTPRILNMLNTKYIIAGQSGPQQVYPNPEAYGNAWFVKSFEIVPDANAELDSIGSLDPKEKAVIQKAYAKNYLDGFTIQADSTNTISLTSYDPEILTYKYSAKTDQLAVFSEIYYPESKGWHVYVDGKRYDGLMKADYVLRAVKVPAGDHSLEMRFEPDSFKNGLMIARIGSVSLLILLLVSLFMIFRKKKDVAETAPNKAVGK